MKLHLGCGKRFVRVYLKYGNLDLILGPLYGRWEIPGTNIMSIIKQPMISLHLRNYLKKSASRTSGNGIGEKFLPQNIRDMMIIHKLIYPTWIKSMGY